MNSKELREKFVEADKYIDEDYIVHEKIDIIMTALCELLDRSVAKELNIEVFDSDKQEDMKVEDWQLDGDNLTVYVESYNSV